MPPDIENQAAETKQWTDRFRRTQYGGTSFMEDLNATVSLISSVTSMVATAMDGAKGWNYASDGVNLANTATAALTEIASTGSVRENPYYLAVQTASFALAAVRLGLEAGVGEDLSKWASISIDASQLLLNHAKQKLAPTEAKNGFKIKSDEVSELQSQVESLQSGASSLQARLSRQNSPRTSVADVAALGQVGGAGHSTRTLPVPAAVAVVGQKRTANSL